MNTDQPLYEQIKSAIDRRIETEEWPANFQVPSEEDLAGEFGASRLTVRRALRELQTDGVLLRIQGRGTFVIGPRMQCAVFNLPDISEEIAFSGGAHSCRVLQHAILGRDSPGRNMLQLSPDDTVFHSRLLHLEDGTPIQLEDRYVNAAEAPAYLEQDFSRITPHNWLLRETSVTTVDNTIRAIRADEEVRKHLQIDENQPACCWTVRPGGTAFPSRAAASSIPATVIACARPMRRAPTASCPRFRAERPADPVQGNTPRSPT